MNRFAEGILVIIIVIPWLCGIAIAKGFWSILFSIIMPPYAWYLLVERIIVMTLLKG